MAAGRPRFADDYSQAPLEAQEPTDDRGLVDGGDLVAATPK